MQCQLLERQILPPAAFSIMVFQVPRTTGGGLLMAAVVEMRAFLQQAATVSVPKRKFHLAQSCGTKTKLVVENGA